MNNKNPWLILAYLLLILCACHHNNEKVSSSLQQPAKVFNPTDSTYMVDEHYVYTDNWPSARPATFVNTPLYTSTDTLSEVKMVIPPFTFFKILSTENVEKPDTLTKSSEGPEYAGGTYIIYDKVLLADGTEGFIVNDNIANFTFKDVQGRYLYMVGAYTTKDKNFTDYVRFVKYDINAKKVVQTLTHRGFPETVIEVNEVKNLPLKNVDFSLHLYAHGDFCGGSITDLIMVNTSSRMAFLPESYDFLDDGGGIDGTVIFIPAINGKGRLCLYPNADTRKNDTIAFPAGIKYLLAETLVMHNEDGQEYRDDNNEPILLKNGKVKMDHHSKTVTYYQWDGKTAKQFYKKKTKI